MSKSTTVNKIGFTPFANDGCQSLLRLTRLGSNPLLMVDVKICYGQQDWVQTHCEWWMSKSTTVNKIGFKPIANGGCQSLLQSTRIHCYFCWINEFTSSMNAFLKMFWLFECWLSITCKCTMIVYSVEILIWIVCFNNYRAEQNYQTLYFQLADI